MIYLRNVLSDLLKECVDKHLEVLGVDVSPQHGLVALYHILQLLLVSILVKLTTQHNILTSTKEAHGSIILILCIDWVH